MWARRVTPSMCIKVFRLLFPVVPTSAYGSLLNAKFTKLLLAYGNNKKLLYHQIVHLFKWYIEVRAGRAREA